MTRLQARISSLERAADRQHHTLSLPTLFTHSSQTAADLAPTSPRNPLFVPTSNQPSFPVPPGHTDPLLSNQTHAWSSIDSSLDLPPSLKATLREVFSKQAWESSSPSSSSLQDAVDQQGWRGLSAVDTTATSDGSFNPLTYKVDMADDTIVAPEASPQPGGASELRRETASTLVGEEEKEMDMNSLTGMLRFVNQTLAMQEDPSLWSSSGQAETGHPLPLQVAATPPFGFS